MTEVIRQLLLPPSSDEWIRFAAVLSGLFLFIGIGEGVRKALRYSPEVTRKLVHVLTGVLIFFAPSLFLSAIPPLTMAVVFIVVNGLAIRFHLFKGMHGTDRPTYGTVYYPFAFLILVLLFWNHVPELVSLGMLSLAIGDASAAIVGNLVSHPHIYRLTTDKKSFEGSAAMFLSTLLALIAGMWYLFDGNRFPFAYQALAASVAALIATACEGISARGFDNFTIPVSVAFVLFYYLVPSPLQEAVQFSSAPILGIAIAVISFRFKFLSASGSVAVFLLACAVYGIGGWKWTLPILSFFVLSSLLSRLGRVRKSGFDSVFEKSSTRDQVQVAANGGVAGAIILLQYAVPSFDFYPVYLGAIAAATADTWGTEIGLLSRNRPISVISLKSVEPGTNGGVTIAGLVGGFAGSLVIAVSGALFHPSLLIIGIVTTAGVAASLIDSCLGATVQAGYRCEVCHRQTEHRIHCGMPTELNLGYRWINNDAVNFMCTLAGAGVVLFAQWFLRFSTISS